MRSGRPGSASGSGAGAGFAYRLEDGGCFSYRYPDRDGDDGLLGEDGRGEVVRFVVGRTECSSETRSWMDL